MTKLQRAALSAIKEAGGTRAAARKLGIDHTYLHRISTGERTNVGQATAERLGLAIVPTPPRYVSAA